MIVSVVVMERVGLCHRGRGGHRGGGPDGHRVCRRGRHREGEAGRGGGGGLGSGDHSRRLGCGQQGLGVRVLVVSGYWRSLR